MGLLDALGLTPPASMRAAAPLAAPPLSEPRQQGEEADDAGSPKAKGRKDDSTKLPGSGIDPRIKDLEDALNDPEKRLKKMADWKIPRYSKEFDTETPEIRFFKDVESGMAKAKEYVEFIQKTADYIQEAGELARVPALHQAAAGLKQVTGKILGGVGSVLNVVEKVDQAVTFFTAMDVFATDTQKMDFRNRDSVKRWVKSAKKLYNATEPFVAWAKTKAIAGAFAGSEAAAALSVTLSYLAAEFYVGLKILEVGIENEDAYFKRYEKIMRTIDNGGVWTPPGGAPPPMPAEWKSRDREAYEAHEREDAELRQAVRNQIRWEQEKAERERQQAIAAEREKHKKEIEAATAARLAAKTEFDTTRFPTLWRKTHRLPLRDQVLKALRVAKNAGGQAAGKWWDCFTYGGGGDEMDLSTGVYLNRVKTNVSLDEARDEIEKFQAVSPRFPPFDKAYAADWKAFAAEKGVSELPP